VVKQPTKVAGSHWKRQRYSAPIDRLARNVAMVQKYSKDVYHLSILCKGTPTRNDAVDGCVRSPDMKKDRFSYSSTAIPVFAKKKIASEARALLYHALFTLKK